jgi:hypothetical protein
MKKIRIMVMVFLFAVAAWSWGIAQLKTCSFKYNSDYGQSGYVGIYKHSSGSIYSYFFPNTSYNWCPQTINF